MIHFGVWAPDQETFWQSWIDAGICTAPGEYAPGYAGMIDTTWPSWDGVVVKNGVPVAGWHTNVRVWGALEVQFTHGLAQTGSIWERTHAAQVFGLTPEEADPVTGFPAGMRSPTGVVYADASAFTSPANVWA